MTIKQLYKVTNNMNVDVLPNVVESACLTKFLLLGLNVQWFQDFLEGFLTFQLIITFGEPHGNITHEYF